MRNWSGTAWTSQTSTDMWIIWGSSWRSWYSGNHLAASRTLQKPLSVNTVVFTNEGSNTTAKREKKIQSKNLYSGHELLCCEKVFNHFLISLFCVCVFITVALWCTCTLVLQMKGCWFSSRQRHKSPLGEGKASIQPPLLTTKKTAVHYKQIHIRQHQLPWISL